MSDVKPTGSLEAKMVTVRASQIKSGTPDFQAGDTVKVHVKIVEGTRERIQIFEGVVLKRKGAKSAGATFTVRKVSYNIGVERTFYLHSPRVEKIEVVTHGKVRRARLFYLRPLRGKATRIKTRFVSTNNDKSGNDASGEVAEAVAAE